MVAVAKLFREVLGSRLDGAEAVARLRELYVGAHFSNGFLHGLPGHMYRA
jgi:hypothetical protein